MTERMHYLDTLRAAMMVLGIAFHAGLIYSVQSTWLVTDPQNSELVTWITYWIHVFRMPAFFIVAGFFCAFLFNKLEVRDFIRVRLNRLGIPLMMTALTLNFGQYLITHSGSAGGFSVLHFFRDGEYLQHLWFLVNLLFYTGTYLVVAFLSGKKSKIMATRFMMLAERLPVWWLLFLLPLATPGIYALNKVGFPLYETFFSSISIFMLMLYIPYFFFGLVLFYSADIYRKWVQVPMLPLVVVIVGIFTLLHVYISREAPEGVFRDIITVYLETALTWALSALVFTLFYRFFQHASHWGRRISEASYTIYLFHHIIVVALGSAMLNLQIPVLVKYLLVCVVTFFTTLVIHERLINRSRVFKWVFSGIWVSHYSSRKSKAEQSR